MGITMQIINISEAQTSLSKLIKKVQTTHEPIIIGKAGKPIAILSAYIEDNTPRKLEGSWKGKVKITEDFDSVDKEIANSFYKATLLPENS